MRLAAGAAGEQLQLAHPQKRWRHAGGDRRRVVHQDVGIERPGVRGVPGPAHGFGPRHIQRQGAGGGNPQGVHELLRQKLAHAGAEHGAAIGAAAVGRGATALELHLPALAVEDAFEHGNGPAIAVAVAGAERALLDVFGPVDREGIPGGPAERPHRLPRHADVAGEQPQELVVVGQRITQAQFAEQASAVRHIPAALESGWVSPARNDRRTPGGAGDRGHRRWPGDPPGANPAANSRPVGQTPRRLSSALLSVLMLAVLSSLVSARIFRVLGCLGMALTLR